MLWGPMSLWGAAYFAFVGFFIGLGWALGQFAAQWLVNAVYTALGKR